jgi:hypothetical protein
VIFLGIFFKSENRIAGLRPKLFWGAFCPKGKLAYLKCGFFSSHIDLFSFLGPQKLISACEDMKIKKQAFSSLVLEFFANQIQLLDIENLKKSKNRRPLMYSTVANWSEQV